MVFPKCFIKDPFFVPAGGGAVDLIVRRWIGKVKLFSSVNIGRQFIELTYLIGSNPHHISCIKSVRAE
jgi:hypothetical protein